MENANLPLMPTPPASPVYISKKVLSTLAVACTGTPLAKPTTLSIRPVSSLGYCLHRNGVSARLPVRTSGCVLHVLMIRFSVLTWLAQSKSWPWTMMNSGPRILSSSSRLEQTSWLPNNVEVGDVVSVLVSVVVVVSVVVREVDCVVVGVVLGDAVAVDVPVVVGVVA